MINLLLASTLNKWLLALGLTGAIAIAVVLLIVGFVLLILYACEPPRYS